MTEPEVSVVRRRAARAESSAPSAPAPDEGMPDAPEASAFEGGKPPEGATAGGSALARVSVVIPAFDEEEAVAGVIRAVADVLDGAGIKHEIIVVDDGSADATAERACAAGARVVRNPTNKGYGFALLRGIEAAANELVVITDADGTYPAEPLPGMIEAAGKYDMVVGRRTGALYHGPPLKRLSRLVFQFLAEFTCGTRIPDINSGLRVLRRSFVLRHRRAISTGYSFTTTVTLIALLEGQHLEYRDISYRQRLGRSKVHWVRDSLRSLQIITETILLYNPLKAFLLLAGASLLAGLVHLAALWFLPAGGAGAVGAVVHAVYTALLVLALGCVGFVAGMAGRRGR
ncbi:MAG: glycosyltransferase family 2 protein [Kiritimatiellaeota bacterium]|nr:glycosyltransferase family 2 protein [Kiritimatiellota bacterium]